MTVSLFFLFFPAIPESFHFADKSPHLPAGRRIRQFRQPPLQIVFLVYLLKLFQRISPFLQKRAVFTFQFPAEGRYFIPGVQSHFRAENIGRILLIFRQMSAKIRRPPGTVDIMPKFMSNQHRQQTPVAESPFIQAYHASSAVLVIDHPAFPVFVRTADNGKRNRTALV